MVHGQVGIDKQLPASPGSEEGLLADIFPVNGILIRTGCEEQNENNAQFSHYGSDQVYDDPPVERDVCTPNVAITVLNVNNLSRTGQRRRAEIPGRGRFDFLQRDGYLAAVRQGPGICSWSDDIPNA